MGRLLIAVVSSGIALYWDIAIPVVALRARRDFSAPAWIIVSCIAIGATWIAVGSAPHHRQSASQLRPSTARMHRMRRTA